MSIPPADGMVKGAPETMSILEKIRTAEEQAAAVRAKNAAQAQRLYEEAEKAARQEAEALLQQTRKENAALLEQASQEAEAESRTSLENTARAEEESLRRAKERIPLAVDRILLQVKAPE